MSICSSPRPYKCYVFADLFPILLVGVGLLLLAVILLSIFYGCKKCDLIRKDILSGIMKIADLIVLDKKIKDDKITPLIKCLKKCADSTKKSKEMVLQKERFEDPQFLGTFMLAMCFSLWYTFAIFWDTFLINRRQDNCVEGLDCYIIQQSEPISSRLNCSGYDMESARNASIICYGFVINVGQAWADAGGALAATTAELLLLSSLFNKITAGIKYSCIEKKTCLQQCCIHTTVTLIGLVVYLAVVLPSVITLSMDKKKYTDVPKVLYTIILFFQILLVANIPWYRIYVKGEDTVPKTTI